MKRISFLLFVLGGMFVIGTRPLLAAEPTLMTLTETHQYTTQRTMTYLSQDPATDPFLQNYFSSYAKEIIFQSPNVSESVSSTTDSGELGDDDKNNRDPESTLGTNESDTQSGGTATNGGSDAGELVADVGTGGDVVESTSAQTDTSPEPVAVLPPPDTLVLSEIATVVPAEPAPAPEIMTEAPQISQPPPQPVAVSTVALTTPGIAQPKTLQLIELYPNTNESDSTEEYVTIKNTGNEAVNLNGWTLKDASGKKFIVTQDEQLAAGVTRQFGGPETEITLNNDTEKLFLIAPDQTIVDDVVYTNAPKGETYSRSSDGWHWPTPVVAVQTVPAPSVSVPSTTQQIVTPAIATTSVASPATTPVTQPIVTSPVTPTPTQPTPLSPAQKTIEITKLYPNTTGDDSLEEFIQIQNTGIDAIDLNGWAIKDASDKTFTITQNQLLAAGAVLQLDRQTTGIVLNNDAENISLTAPDKTLIETVSYSNAPIGETYDHTQNIWHWSSTAATVEQTPISTDPVGTIVTNTTSTTSTPTITLPTTIAPVSSSPPHSLTSSLTYSIASAKSKPDATAVDVTGIVRVLPGILGKQFFYIEDAQDGVQIYKYDAIFPDMHIGQSVRVKGEMSTSGTERRVKVTATGSFEPFGDVTEQKPTTKYLLQLESSLSGKLIQTNGTVVSSGSGHLLLEQDGVQLDLPIIATTKIDLSVLKAGMSVQATGILRASGDVVKLYPRSQEDLLVLDTTKPPAFIGTISSGKDVQNQTAQETAMVMTLGTVLVLSSWAVRHFIQKKHLAYANHILKLRTEASH